MVEEVTGVIVHVSDGDFQDVVLGSSVPVLVDFWAPWCGPCRMIAPVLEELAGDYEGRAVVAKVNTDENTGYAVRLGIRGIPTMIIFKDGQEVDRIVGLVPKHELTQKLDAALT